MSAQRGRRLLARLRHAGHPISGGTLARELGVSRQVIVQDVAVLRAAGNGILATPRGYVIEPEMAPRIQAVLAVRHGRTDTADELNALVDLGLEVVDVIVEHPVFGEMRGMLRLTSREDVARFVARLARSGAGLLSATTGGVHLHTVRGPRRELLTKARSEMRRRGYLIGR